jgi:hypothetical protein
MAWCTPAGEQRLVVIATGRWPPLAAFSKLQSARTRLVGAAFPAA